MNCLKCGQTAEMLLNIQSCVGARCPNFNKRFYDKHRAKESRLFRGIDKLAWVFLGSYFDRQNVIWYDLYHYGQEVQAVYGTVDVNNHVSQPVFLGNIVDGSPKGVYLDFWGLEEVNASGKEALLEAAARAKL
tara:strand:- start:175 stop:573 length:399 start_codon:yes stop_codon:yes gene_type:complete